MAKTKSKKTTATKKASTRTPKEKWVQLSPALKATLPRKITFPTAHGPSHILGDLFADPVFQSVYDLSTKRKLKAALRELTAANQEADELTAESQAANSKYQVEIQRLNRRIRDLEEVIDRLPEAPEPLLPKSDAAPPFVPKRHDELEAAALDSAIRSGDSLTAQALETPLVGEHKPEAGFEKVLDAFAADIVNADIVNGDDDLIDEDPAPDSTEGDFDSDETAAIELVEPIDGEPDFLDEPEDAPDEVEQAQALRDEVNEMIAADPRDEQALVELDERFVHRSDAEMQGLLDSEGVADGINRALNGE